MNTYLIYGNYIGAEGNQGLLKEGGTSRQESISKLVASLGGKMISTYYALGEVDIYAIIEMPDAASVAACSLKARSSGIVSVSTIALLTPAQMDTAAKKMPDYRAPGK